MVLDVSTFKHPGPQYLITDRIGEDVTELFLRNLHSPYAHELAKTLQVGILKNDEKKD